MAAGGDDNEEIPVTYDLLVFATDRAISAAGAARKLARLADAGSAGTPTDTRLAAFAAEIERRHPWIATGDREPAGAPAFEFDRVPGFIFVGLGWPDVEAVGGEIAALAWATDLAIFDPQQEKVALPARLGGTGPLEWSALPALRDQMDGFLGLLSTSFDGAADEAAATRHVVEAVGSMGGWVESPSGYVLTPEMAAEMLRDPARLPSQLQTPDNRARLLRDLGSKKQRARSQALDQLSGWDPDPEVTAALRPYLASDDYVERFEAASGLARQRDTASLEAIIEVIRRDSPAGGASVGAMLIATRSALELAMLVDSDAVGRVRAVATECRGPRPTRPKAADRVFNEELDQLLADDWQPGFRHGRPSRP
jgi:hypothetical protein